MKPSGDTRKNADTIVALASPPGRAPRAILRLSGPATGEILATHLDGAPVSRASARASLRLGPRRLPVLVARYLAPRSYTGEDAAEVLFPGNPALAARLIDRFCAHPDARPAGPGEFTARAYLNGRLTLEQAEGVAALIAARTDAELEGARRLLAGELGERYRALADRLTSALALVEAGIDFSDQEDVVPIAPHDLARELDESIAAAAALLGRAATPEPAEPLVVLAGPPSAGKSTLFNALLGRARALTDAAPGTTRDALVEMLDLRDVSIDRPRVQLADLPGLDASPATAIGAASQRAAREALARADVVVLCDPAGRFDESLAPAPARAIRVRTMADLPGPGVSDALPVCALDGWNVAALRRAIADAASTGAVGGGVGGSDAPAVVPRHRIALATALRHLRAARDAIEPAAARLDEPEILAASLRPALDAIGEITGRVSPDDVVARIFATFCVGK